jgi:hypothetical protein
MIFDMLTYKMIYLGKGCFSSRKGAKRMHITIEKMSGLDFQSFRKTASIRVRARRLTEKDVKQRRGIIYTLEGPVAFQAGDYLVRGIKGEEYPITPQNFAVLYDERSMVPDGEGFAWYRPANIIHQAVQIAEPFTVERKAGEIYTGKAGDYLVRTGQGSSGRIVDRTIFEQSYERVVEQRESK